MKIMLSKNQWQKIGQEAGWADEISAFNLDIHQILEYGNQQTMLDYIDGVMERLYPGDKKSFQDLQKVREFLEQLMKFSKKIKYIVEQHEKDIPEGERVSLPEDIDTGKEIYEKEKNMREKIL